MRSKETVVRFGSGVPRAGPEVRCIYVLCYMVGGPATSSLPDYAYGWHHEKGRPVFRIKPGGAAGYFHPGPEKRPGDIVKVLDRFAAVDGVDFVGLDYIRPVFGGNELVDDFIREMPGVQKPVGYDEWTKEQRMSWIARGRYIAPRASLRQ
jgi:hypothetical protein